MGDRRGSYGSYGGQNRGGYGGGGGYSGGGGGGGGGRGGFRGHDNKRKRDEPEDDGMTELCYGIFYLGDRKHVGLQPKRSHHRSAEHQLVTLGFKCKALLNGKAMTRQLPRS